MMFSTGFVFVALLELLPMTLLLIRLIDFIDPLTSVVLILETIFFLSPVSLDVDFR